MSKFKIQNSRIYKGQSLFEVVVAIAVSALIVVALVSVTSNSIQNSSFSKNKALAATYAQQASEWLRGQRDSDINVFVTHAATGTFCLPDLSSSNPWQDVGHCSPDMVIPGTPFLREVALSVDTQNGKDVIDAGVTVSWTDSQGMHEVMDSTTLTQR